MYLTKEKSSPYYQVIYLRNGKRTKKSTKKKLKSEALKFLSDFEKNIKTEKKEKKILISEFQKEYEKFILETKSKSYLRSVKLSFRKFIEFAGDVYLNEIDIKLFEKFIQITFKRAKYSAGLYYRTLKSALSTALRWNYIKSNPLKSIQQPKQVSKLPLFISEVELQKILKNVLKPSIFNMIILSYDSGLRLGEVVNLKWSDLDLQQKIIKVSNKLDFQTKSKKDRIIPLTDRLYKLFLSIAPNVFTIKENDSFIFLAKNKVRFNLDFVSKSFKRAVKDSNVNQAYTYHILRHSFASNLVQRGVSLYVVSKLLGHSDLRTSQIYSHLQPKNLFEAVDKLNNKIA